MPCKTCNTGDGETVIPAPYTRFIADPVERVLVARSADDCRLALLSRPALMVALRSVVQLTQLV